MDFVGLFLEGTAVRKGIRFVLLLVVVLALACSAYAATDTFVSSVTAKPAPEIIASGGTTAKPVVEIVDGDHKNMESFAVESVVVTAVAEKNEEYVEENVQTVLTEVYEQLSDPEVKLSAVMPRLLDVIEKAAVEDTAMKELDVDSLVVKDLFHVNVSEAVAEALNKEGNFLKLTFDAKLAEEQFLVVMVCVDGEWLPVDYIWNEDGTITCMFDAVGAVAFLVNV